MRKIFIITVVNSYDGGCEILALANTLEEAKAKMRKDYEAASKKIAEDNESETAVGELNEMDAWVLYNGDDERYMWTIHEANLPD